MITVAELEELDGLRLQLIAGHEGAGRSIRWVASSELPEPAIWLRGGELLLTTGLGLASAASPSAYVDRLADAGLAGIGFALGIHQGEVPDAVIAAAERRGFPIIAVPYETSFVAITEAVMTRIVNEQYAQLERAMAVHDGLIGLVLDGAGLDAILRAAAEAVGAELALVRRDGLLLAATGDAPDLLAAIASVVAAGGPADEVPLAGGAVAFDVGVSAPGEAILVAQLDHPVRDWDRAQLQQARTVLALELAKHRAVDEAERRITGNLVDELLSGQTDDRTIARRLRTFGLDGAPGLAVIVARPPTAGGAGALLRRVADSLGVGSITAIRHGEVCAIVAAGNDAAAEEQAWAVAAGMSDAGLRPRVGVSRSHQRPSELRDAYEEAWYALEGRIGSGHDDGGVATSRDLGSVGLLLSLQDERGLELFARTTLGPLADPQRRTGEALLETLRAFISCNGHLTDAAERLGVHRHTLRHRVRRIEEMTGRDLGSAADRLDLWLALRARDVAARRREG